MSKITTFATRNSKFPTGELYAVNIDGKKEIILTGIQAKRSSDTAKDDPKKPATLIDLLPEEPNKIMVQFLSNEIRADGLKITIYKKKCNSNEIINCSTEVDNKNTIGQELKLAILQKASELKTFSNEKEVKEYRKKNLGNSQKVEKFPSRIVIAR